MKMKIIPKKNTTRRWHKLFLLKNRTMTRGENHPQLEMLVNRILVDGLYLLVMAAVAFLAKVVTSL
jgi:hypothetical protein